MNDEWKRRTTVKAIYGDWAPMECEDAEGLTDVSLGPRPSILDVEGPDGRRALAGAARFGCRVMVIDPSAPNVDGGITDAPNRET